jgi:hypothetical protein
MKFIIIIAFFLLLCGCESSRERFAHDMKSRYEMKCDQYYFVYCSGDIEHAKKALHDIIDLSQTEKSKAKFYWNFDTVIAFSYARLAMIAEKQGNEEEAKRLFARASDYKTSGDAAFNQELKNEPWMAPSAKINIVKLTPDQWRKGITAIDKQKHVKWEFADSAPN